MKYWQRICKCFSFVWLPFSGGVIFPSQYSLAEMGVIFNMEELRHACRFRLDKRVFVGIMLYVGFTVECILERWLSWSKAHDWKSCVG